MHYYDRFTHGDITIEELRQFQANDMPRCVNHNGKPAFAIIPDGPVCEECGADWIRETHLWRIAQAVVIGGVEGV